MDEDQDLPHESLELRVPTPDELERVWRTFWLPTLSQDGKISVERLKGELYDAWHLVNEARKVYHHVTGGLSDDLTASAEGIIATFERRQADARHALEEKIQRLESENRALRQKVASLSTTKD